MEGLIHGVPGLLPFVHAPPELAQAPASSLRQRSLGRSNINFPFGSSSVLPGLRAQGPSGDQGCGPPPPATVLLRAPPPPGQPRPHLFLPRPAPVHLLQPGPHPAAKEKVANRVLALQLPPFARVSWGLQTRFGASFSARGSPILFEVTHNVSLQFSLRLQLPGPCAHLEPPDS